MYEIKLVKDAIAKLKPTCVDSFIDKAHYFATVKLLLFFCFVVGCGQMFGDPISCMVPQQYNDAWTSYVHDYCFVTGTFVLESAKEMMPDEALPSGEKKIYINYYQWLPYMLVFQALCFYLPHLIWSQIQQMQTDVAFMHIVDKCKKARDSTVEERKDQVKEVVQELVKTFEHRQIAESNSGLGSFGLAVYVFSKVLYVCNVFVQICVLNFFVSGITLSSCLQMFLDAWKSAFLDQAVLFPRVSFCTFNHNFLGNMQQYTVQCVLMANMVYEKIFLILYVWFSLLLIASVIDIFYTIVRYVSSFGYRRASRRFLKVHPNKDRLDWNKFAVHQLGYDGLLLLRFIELNAGFAIASEVACRFYDSLRRRAICVKIQRASDSLDDTMKMTPKQKVGRRSITGGSLAKDIDECWAKDKKETSSFLES